ncbi:hypothetical protein PR048_004093 [Dryococelus australis]|uniref:Uncharacterized protein n=1 Tax=Dryococelus australis TaxID=614101 RepID=A0ABQ9I5J4_9NEOP|nr:hypothetical protein PR048_004093 [Dryococelus australis]
MGASPAPAALSRHMTNVNVAAICNYQRASPAPGDALESLRFAHHYGGERKGKDAVRLHDEGILKLALLELSSSVVQNVLTAYSNISWKENGSHNTLNLLEHTANVFSFSTGCRLRENAFLQLNWPLEIAAGYGAVVTHRTRIREDPGSIPGPAIPISGVRGFPKSLQRGAKRNPKNPHVVCYVGAAGAERLACSPPAKANGVRSPAGSLPGYSRVGIVPGRSRWSSGFSRGSPIPPNILILELLYTHLASPKRHSRTSLSKVDQISSLTLSCEATANEHTAEAPVCRGVRSLAYESLISQNFPNPSYDAIMPISPGTLIGQWSSAMFLASERSTLACMYSRVPKVHPLPSADERAKRRQPGLLPPCLFIEAHEMLARVTSGNPQRGNEAGDYYSSRGSAWRGGEFEITLLPLPTLYNSPSPGPPAPARHRNFSTALYDTLCSRSTLHCHLQTPARYHVPALPLVLILGSHEAEGYLGSGTLARLQKRWKETWTGRSEHLQKKWREGSNRLVAKCEQVKARVSRHLLGYKAKLLGFN